MQFVDRHRRGQRIGRRARLHPGGIGPGVVFGAPCHRSGRRCGFGIPRERIGLVQPFTGVREDRELVALPVHDTRHIEFPQPRAIAAHIGPVHIRVPAVEIADHGDGAGIRRPYRETRRAGTQPTTQLLVQPPMGTFAEQVDVLLAQGVHGQYIWSKHSCSIWSGGSGEMVTGFYAPARQLDCALTHTGNKKPCARNSTWARQLRKCSQHAQPVHV